MKRAATLAVWIAAAVAPGLAPGAAGADGDRPAARDGEDADRPPFWQRLLAPHAGEIDRILARVAAVREDADRRLPGRDRAGGVDPARAETRARLWDELERDLRRAAALDPRRLDVRRELAVVLDEAGRPDAEDALAGYLAAVGAERGAELRPRLARLRARRGDAAAAIADLRIALAPGALVDPADRARTTFLLAEVYMDQGRIADAIDLLAGGTSSPSSSASAGGTDVALLLALAVAYDRDEQVGRAHAVLDRVAALGIDPLAVHLRDGADDTLPFAPITDRPYFSGLALEAMGLAAEARVAWAAYARVPGARYAARARAHLAALATSGPGPSRGRAH